MSFRPSWRNCAIIAASNVFLAFGIYNIHDFAGVTEGGVLGLVLLCHHWFNISPAISGLVLNGLCFLYGFRVLGIGFIFYSGVSTVAFSASYAVMEHTPHLFPWMPQHPLVAALLGALFIGIGVGICVRAGAASGGDDALAMALSHQTGQPIERIYLVSDITVLALSASYLPMTNLACSLLTVVLSGQIIGLIQRLPPIDRKNDACN